MGTFLFFPLGPSHGSEWGQCVDVITYPPWLVIQWEWHHCGTLKHPNSANFFFLSCTRFFYFITIYPSHFLAAVNFFFGWLFCQKEERFDRFAHGCVIRVPDSGSRRTRGSGQEIVVRLVFEKSTWPAPRGFQLHNKVDGRSTWRWAISRCPDPFSCY